MCVYRYANIKLSVYLFTTKYLLMSIKSIIQYINSAI